MTVEPPGYHLWDEDAEEYRCPFCQARMLRIENYAECTECGERFQKQTGGEQATLPVGDER